MKYLNLVIILIFSFKLNSQVVFPNNNAVWVYNVYVEHEHKGYTNILYYKGDSIIEEKKYSKLFLKPEGYWNGDEVRGPSLIRSENNKVYLWSEDKLKDLLLYDFTLEIGDTIHDTFKEYNDCENYTTVIDLRDSTFKDGNIRRIWELESHDSITDEIRASNFFIIDGVGSDLDFFNMFGVSCLYELSNMQIYNNLTCFIGDSLLLFGDCDSWTDKTDNISCNENIIYPNPVSEQLSLLIPSGNKMVFLYDINGNLVFEGIDPTSKIDISHLSGGLYFIKIKTKDKTYLNKLIKL